MKYTRKSFTLPAVEKPPEKCDHSWVNEAKGTCVMCGAAVPRPTIEVSGKIKIDSMDPA